MAWIKTIDEKAAAGSLKKIYDAAVKRAGKVFNIVKISSLSPDIVRSSTHFYTSLMHGDGPLTRAQREMIGVVVSKTNECSY